jgi:hypothetical protein
MSRKVLAKGLHCIQGTTAAGTANIAKVAIAKYTKRLSQPSVNRSKVIPNEILLRVVATVDIVSRDAP